MKKIITHVKTSGIMAGNGMVSYSGVQLLSNSISDSVMRGIVLFIFMTTMGVVSKLILDRVAPKT
jgi:hypothetical protein